MTDKPKPKRRWLQYSLRTLLLVVTVFCIWLGIATKRARDQKHAVEMILELGGTVFYDYQYVEDDPQIGTGIDLRLEPAIPDWLLRSVGHDLFYRVVWLNRNGARDSEKELHPLKDLRHLRFLGLNNAEITLDIMDSIRRMTDLRWLSLSMCQITDEHVERLRGMPHLERLHLSFNGVTDEAMSVISGLRSIRFLQLQDNQITDNGLQHLKKLHNLDTLILAGNHQITDAGLVHLLSLGKLRKLSLWKISSITDEGLLTLRGLSNLQELDLSRTQVTDEGVMKLQQALPLIKISR